MGACFICRFASALRDGLVFTELARLRDDGSLLLARLRWNLTVEAHKAAALLRCEGLPPSAENIATKLVLTVGAAKPRSRFVPCPLDDVTVEKAIGLVAADVAEAKA